MKRKLPLFKNVFSAGVILLTAVWLLGCGGMKEKTAPPTQTTGAAKPAAAPPASQSLLADTEWRLVEIQSMDDATGTKRPDDPSRYTMRLNADGTVNMHLNCNRANGTWRIAPSADPTNGRFEFGPLATTKALCPPPSLDEEVASQAAYVRGYLLKDGRLYLSLLADGGIYAWEPDIEERYQAEPDPLLEAAVLAAAPSYTREAVDAQGGVGEARYVYGRADLDGDGRDEVMVYLMGSIFCGTGGCNLMIFSEGANGYTLINDFPISRVPVIVSKEKSNGWNHLVRLESGGGAPASYVVHAFDGRRYAERERLPGDAVPGGKRYLAGDFTFQDGIPLKPRQ